MALAVEVTPMGEICSHTTTYLALNELAANPKLAQRLPADLARRFHALPLTEDNGRITVAMADPTDADARAAVAAALGSESCVVQADPVTIDALLAEIWDSFSDDPLDLGVCSFPEPVSDQVWQYAQALAGLLHAGLSCLNTAAGVDALAGEGECVQPDLVIFEDPEHPLVRRLRLRTTAGSVANSRHRDLPPAVMVARRPRWPLKSIRLVIRGQDRDIAALDWVLRLARQSFSRVTVLAIVPPVPAMYGQRLMMTQGLPALLTAGSPLGRQMRRVARSLVDWEVDSTLRLGDTASEAAFHRPCRRLQRWLEGDLIGQLLRWVDRPVLIAKTQKEG
jgi:hypothetical protein